MSNKVRIKYWYDNRWHLSGWMFLHDALSTLKAYVAWYGKAEITNSGD